MMGRSLLLGCDRFTQRQNLRHDWFDLSGVDQLADLSQICRIGMNRDTRAANAALLDYSGVGAREERNDEAASRHHTDCTCRRFPADPTAPRAAIFAKVVNLGLWFVHCRVSG